MSEHPLSDIRYCSGCGTELSLDAHRSRKWCSERCRKRSYGDPCVDCGARTSFGADRRRVPEPRCQGCAYAHRTRWTSEAIHEAMWAWEAEYGEPPAHADWSPWEARHSFHDEQRARRFEEAEGRWPAYQTVIDVFGTWNAGLWAAGYESREAHGGGANVARRRSERAKMERAA